MSTAGKACRRSVCAALTLLCPIIGAADWPTFGHDNRRSHITPDRVPSTLRLVWAWASVAPPQTAWPGPARWDAYAGIKDIASMRNFDSAFFVTAAGEDLWFGSSVDDAVHCLGARDGAERWVFTTDAPVRLPPSWADGRLYAGSDDGHVYCLEAKTGALLWQFKASQEDHLIVANSKLISSHPCRTGVIVQGGKAYFGASLLPWSPSFLCALDALTGRVSGPGTYQRSHPGLTMQGPLVASRDRLFVSQGRQAPIICELSSGDLLGSLGKAGDGGVWAIVTEDSLVFHGRGQNHGSQGELRGFDAGSKESIATFPKARHMNVTSDVAYLLGDGSLRAFDRRRYLALHRTYAAAGRSLSAAQGKLKKLGKDAPESERQRLTAEIATANAKRAEAKGAMGDCLLWETSTTCRHALVLTADLLFAGDSGRVAGFAKTDGKRVWEASVDGRAHGLAAANGRLFVSTDSGSVYCFAAE